MKLLIFLLALISLQLTSQTIEGVNFDTYKVAESKVTKKAKLKLASNPYKDKTKEIAEGYENAIVSYAGYYVTILWLCGDDCVKGVMIDSRTGVIYKLPLSKENVLNHCKSSEDIFDRYLFLPNSRLFVTSVCRDVKKDEKITQHQSFFFYQWNESVKNFLLLKKLNKKRDLE